MSVVDEGLPAGGRPGDEDAGGSRAMDRIDERQQVVDRPAPEGADDEVIDLAALADEPAPQGTPTIEWVVGAVVV